MGILPEIREKFDAGSSAEYHLTELQRIASVRQALKDQKNILKDNNVVDT
ncbi:MAG: hypothetical protein ACI4PQ_04260 [Butyricicoccaceae bacterium]